MENTLHNLILLKEKKHQWRKYKDNKEIQEIIITKTIEIIVKIEIIEIEAEILNKEIIIIVIKNTIIINPQIKILEKIENIDKLIYPNNFLILLL
jgi:hypothetical protein